MAKAISLALALLTIAQAHAIIFYSTGDPEYNTTAPTASDIVNSGWDLEGQWNFFLGTPIGPHHFLAANHVGGNVGDPFIFRGRKYTTVSSTVDSLSDLRIWEVAETFPAWAELYDGNTETGLDLVVFGRGVQRGAEVRVNDILKGWQWGDYDGRTRWGRNRVSNILSSPQYPNSELLVAAFDANGSADECHLGTGDSSGAVFIKENTTWRLAGINFSVDGLFNTDNTSGGFNAAIFDEGGLYIGSSGSWRYVTPRLTAQPSHFYATRVKTRITWIQSVLSGPLTPNTFHLFESADMDLGFTEVTNVTVDADAKTIRTPIPDTPRCYQISSLSAVNIVSTRVENGSLVLTYQ